MNKLVQYHLVNPGDQFEFKNDYLYSYLYGANGTFVACRNDYFEAIIPVASIKDERRFVRGLGMIKPHFKILDKVPGDYLSRMVSLSRRACPNEILFHLDYSYPNLWRLSCPAQINSPVSVTPVDDLGYVPIEIHSHNTMQAFFSETDNRDETGMRIYGVLGRVDQPVVDFRLRVSIYGHYAYLPYQLVFWPTPEVQNVND